MSACDGLSCTPCTTSLDTPKGFGGLPFGAVVPWPPPGFSPPSEIAEYLASAPQRKMAHAFLPAPGIPSIPLEPHRIEDVLAKSPDDAVCRRILDELQKVLNLFQNTSYMKKLRPRFERVIGCYLYNYQKPGMLRERIMLAGKQSRGLVSTTEPPQSIPSTGAHECLRPYFERANQITSVFQEVFKNIAATVPEWATDYSCFADLSTDLLSHGWAIGFRGDGVEGVQHTLQTGNFEGAKFGTKYGHGVYLDLAPQHEIESSVMVSALQYMNKYAKMARTLPQTWTQDWHARGSLHANGGHKVGFVQFGLVFLGQYPNIVSPQESLTGCTNFGANYAYTSTIISEYDWVIAQHGFTVPLGVLVLQ